MTENSIISNFFKHAKIQCLLIIKKYKNFSSLIIFVQQLIHNIRSPLNVLEWHVLWKFMNKYLKKFGNVTPCPEHSSSMQRLTRDGIGFLFDQHTEKLSKIQTNASWTQWFRTASTVRWPRLEFMKFYHIRIPRGHPSGRTQIGLRFVYFEEPFWFRPVATACRAHRRSVQWRTVGIATVPYRRLSQRVRGLQDRYDYRRRGCRFRYRNVLMYINMNYF